MGRIRNHYTQLGHMCAFNLLLDLINLNWYVCALLLINKSINLISFKLVQTDTFTYLLDLISLSRYIGML